MKIVDLHPDDLLDKEARGELSMLERTRLDAHLARCETCRFEREVRADFADELFAGEDEEMPSQRLMPVLPPSSSPSPEEEASDEELEPPKRISTRPSRVRRNVRMMMLVAAALLIGTGATAGGVGGRVWAHVASALSFDDAPAMATAAPQPTVTAVPATTHAMKHEVAPDSTALVMPSAEPVIVPASLSVTAPAAPFETPATLFDAANKARNAGDYGHAISLHRKLETTFPHSREAHTSYATLGRLLLDRGDASGALAAFDAYQAKGPGPLDEAVLVGRATALERLGRDADARMAWTQLLRDFPDTPYREHAESKLKGR